MIVLETASRRPIGADARTGPPVAATAGVFLKSRVLAATMRAPGAGLSPEHTPGVLTRGAGPPGGERDDLC